MDWCRVVGPRGPVPAARRKASFQQTTWPSRPVRATRRANTGQGRAGQGQGRAGQAKSPPQARRRLEFASLGPKPPWVYPPPPQKSTDHAKRWWVWGSSLLPNGKEVIRGAASLQSSCTGRLYPPSPLGRGPRSEPRAPMQALSAV